jgi:molecular chaperone DnaK
MGKAIGIDLGTTNTAVAVLIDGRPRVLEDEKGYKVLPSCVALKGDGSAVVGQAARNLIITQPENTAYAIKRLMGRRFDSVEVGEVQKLVSYKIAEADDGMCKLRVGEDWYTPVEISSMILKVAKEMAERALGEPVDEAVITVPAYFNHAQRSATFEAARMAGLRCDRILNEPTAAALAYGHRKDVERRIVVYDLGGGTFDVSVLQLARGIYEVLATSGETHLGGEDFDQRIVDQLSETFQSQTGVDPRLDPTSLQRLKDAAERAKCELSFTDRTTILIPMITMADSLETSLSRLALEGLVEDLVSRTLEITRNAIKAAGLRLADIDDVILVGGQTRMPRVREAIRSLFQKEPSRSVHPEEVVAIGAAVHATSLTNIDGHKPLLLDVTPFDLGIDVAGGLFKRIIQANSQVPASFTEAFATVKDNQKLVRVAVRQGSEPLAVDNEFLGEFIMAGLTPAPRMETKVEVTFKIDTNGMLHVSATEAGSGERKRITIRNYAEFVKGDGVAPDLEGDVGGPEQLAEIRAASSAAEAANEAHAAAKRGKPGFLSRLFGGRKAGPGPVSEAKPEIAVAAAEGEEVERDGAVPEMPSFMQELGAQDVASMEPIDDYLVPEGLDEVGGGLDDLVGLGDLAPLSVEDLAPITNASPSASPDLDPVSELPALGTESVDEMDSEAIFALPDGGDDEYYDDEEVEEIFGDDLDYTEDALTEEVGSPAYTDPAGHAVEALSPAPGTVGSEEETEAPALPKELSLDDLLASDDFEVDDSSRSLVQPVETSNHVPLPSSAFAEELLWEDGELPDDGTVEYTRDGATATPRAATDDLDPADGLPGDPTLIGIDPSVAEDAATSGYADLAQADTLIDTRPDDFEEAATDPPLETDADGKRLQVNYGSAKRLAEELVTGLKRGGCFVATDAPLSVGAECVIEYRSPDMEEIVVLDAVVTWSTSGESSQSPGMDVEFKTPKSDRRKLIRELEALR